MTNGQKIFAFLFAVGIGAALSLCPPPAHAAGCTSGQLIRASSPSVYYCGADGKRYVFPNQSTYSTWYSDFSSVERISDEALAAVPIGGNVTYKPGVRMVKITTSSRVYAVAAGGILRAVASEAVAEQLYGADWNRQIDDVPDAFFVNYLVGADITDASQFSPATVRAGAISIGADRRINVPTGSSPTAAQGVTMTLSPDVTSLSSGDSATITVTANDASGISTVSIFLNGNLLKLCEVGGGETSATCSKVVYGGDFADGAILNIYGQEVSRYGIRTATATRAVTAHGGGANDSGSVTLSFSSDKTTLKADETVTVTASAHDPAGLSSVSVFVNGALVQRCSQNGVVTNASCSSVIYASNYPAGSTVAVYGQEINANGTPTLSASSSLAVTSDSSTNGSASISFSPDATTLKADETMDVTVEAYDRLGFTELSVYVNGARVQSCGQSGVSTRGRCTATLYGTSYAVGSVISIYGRATNTDGQSYDTATRSVTITAGSTSNNSVSLSFSPYAQYLAAGQITTVTATARFAHSVSAVEIYVNDALAKTCTLSGSSATATCSVALNGSNYASGSTVTVYAEARSTGGESGKSATSTLNITSASSSAGSVSLFVSPTLSTISGTQSVTVTANAYDPSGLASVDIYVNGSSVRSCSQVGSWPTGASCSYTLSAGNYSPNTNLNIFGRGISTLTTATSSATTTIRVE